MADNHTYTNVARYWNCDDCGAYAKTKKQVKHYPNCEPGSSKKWEQYYANNPDETETDYTQDGEGDGIVPAY